MPNDPAHTAPRAVAPASERAPAVAKSAIRSYDGVERRYQTGDILLFAGTAWDSRVIRWATKSDYSHCGLIYVWDGPSRTNGPAEAASQEPRVYVLESRGKQGVRLVPMSLLVEDPHYEKVDHYVGELLTSAERDKLVNFCFPHLGKEYDYHRLVAFGLFLLRLRLSRAPQDAQAWRQGLARRFNARLEVDRRRQDQQFFCSELLAAAFDYVGVDVYLPTALISPQDLIVIGPKNDKGEPFLTKMPPVKG